jgi:hypothetical protein
MCLNMAIRNKSIKSIKCVFFIELLFLYAYFLNFFFR